MKAVFIGIIVLLTINSVTAQNAKDSLSENLLLPSSKEELIKVTSQEENKIHVLNFGVAHLTRTTDANASFRDVNSAEVKKDLKEIVTRLLNFKPTVICIELSPENNDFVNETYQKYIIDQTNRLNYSDELNAIGLEVGRLSGVKKIYGIDSQVAFHYQSAVALAEENVADSLFVKKMMGKYKTVNNLPLLEQFREINTKDYKMETFNFYNFLATKHSADKYEGADIIAEFYKRNLRMYSNFSDIPLTKDDRVLIILGATHTAYFDVFIENNPKYELENVSSYTDY